MDKDERVDSDSFALIKTLQIPAPVASLAFGHAGHVFVGSNDGSLRVYDLSSFKVTKAIRGLGSEISSIVCFKTPASESSEAWIACGRHALRYKFDSPNMILTSADATSTVDLCESNDDVLNELSLNSSKSHLAFSTDSGTVGVVDLSTMKISRMKRKHTSVCGSVKFIPDRPRELVSGGYDNALLHMDYMQGSLLSRRVIPPFPSAGGMTLSPPFVLCSALSPAGVIAAGTADGRLFIGFGGEKRPSGGSSGNKKKRAKKWNGLDEEAELIEKFAEGPVVAVQFSDSETFVVSTLMGTMMQFKLEREEDNDGAEVVKIWENTTKTVEKVNALVMDSNSGRIIVGGLPKEGKGVLEIWDRKASDEQDVVPNAQ